MTSMGQEKISQSAAPALAEVTVGIDISKQTLDARLLPGGDIRQFTNDRKGHASLIAWAGPLQPVRIVFEATGSYHRLLELALGKAGLPAVKINPLQARRFAEATGRRAKTDQVDAAMLARFGATLRPAVPAAKDETIDQLAELLTTRRALVKDRTAAANRGKVLTLGLLKRQSAQHLAQIESQIGAIDQQWAAILGGCPRVARPARHSAEHSRHRRRHRARLDGRHARTWYHGRETGREPGRPCPRDTPVRNLARQELHPGRPRHSQAGTLHAGFGGYPLQSAHEEKYDALRAIGKPANSR
jgi:transposase